MSTPSGRCRVARVRRAAGDHVHQRQGFLREHLPGNAAAKDENNASKAGSIRNTRPPTLRSSWWNRQERLDKIPQRI
jgi:hypothetical protein